MSEDFSSVNLRVFLCLFMADFDCDGFWPSGWHPESSDSDDDGFFDQTLGENPLKNLVFSDFDEKRANPSGNLDDLSEPDSDDVVEDTLRSSYLRFRDAFVGSKQQRKLLTFERYLDLVEQAQRAAVGAVLEPNEVRLHVVLTEAHLEAFRASRSELSLSFPEVSLPTATTVEPLPHTPAVVFVPSCPPEVSVPSAVVPVEPPLIISPHASATKVSVPSTSSLQSPSIKPHGRRWNRRHRARGR